MVIRVLSLAMIIDVFRAELLKDAKNSSNKQLSSQING